MIKFKRAIYFGLLILTFILIFNFSNQDGDKSMNTSSRTMQIIANIMNVPKDQQKAFIENGQPLLRKIAHFSIYAMIGVWSICLCNTYPISDRKKILIPILIGCIYACTDEFHQSLTPNRGPGIGDVILDTIGTAFGTIFVMQFIVAKRIKKMNKRV